jgi:hypothetical protein
VKPVTTGNEVTGQFVQLSVVLVADWGPCGIDVVHRNVLHVVVRRTARRQTSLHQIFHDFVLTVDLDRLAAGEFG